MPYCLGLGFKTKGKCDALLNFSVEYQSIGEGLVSLVCLPAGKAKQAQAPPPTPAHFAISTSSKTGIPRRAPRGKLSKIVSANHQQCVLSPGLHLDTHTSAALRSQQNLTPRSGGSTARRDGSLFVEVRQLHISVAECSDVMARLVLARNQPMVNRYLIACLDRMSC